MGTPGKRSWWCDVGGHVVDYDSLRRQYTEWCEPIGSNYLLWSSYNSAFWSCTAADAGRISMGPYGKFYASVSRSQPTTLTDTNGSQTWTGSGTLRSTVAVNGAAWTTFHFDAVVGPHQVPDADPTYSVSIGICDSVGTPITTEKTYSNQVGMRHVRFAKTIADVAAPSTLYFYMTVTVASAAEKWFADMFRVEKNVTAATEYLETKGAAINHTVPTLVSGYVIVCPEHVMPVRDRWSKRIPPEEPTAPIPVDVFTPGES